MASSAWRTASASYLEGHCAEVGAWRKSAASGGGVGNGENCAEIGAWRKSPYSINDAGAGSECAEVGAWRTSLVSYQDGHCAEVGTDDAVVGIRDTKQAYLGDERTVLEFSPGAWGRFLAEVRQQ